jgi:hypothetical protein
LELSGEVTEVAFSTNSPGFGLFGEGVAPWWLSRELPPRQCMASGSYAASKKAESQ